MNVDQGGPPDVDYAKFQKKFDSRTIWRELP